MKEKCKNLEKKLENLCYKETKKELKMLKHKQNLMETEEMGQQIKTAKQNLFENANKLGRWLAYKLRKQKWKEKNKLIS